MKVLRRTRESSVEAPAVALARASGVPALKLSNRYDSGWPDRLFLFPGRAVFVEFKKPETPAARKLQEHRHETLRGLGFTVYLVTDHAEFTRVFESEIQRASI